MPNKAELLFICQRANGQSYRIPSGGERVDNMGRVNNHLVIEFDLEKVLNEDGNNTATCPHTGADIPFFVKHVNSRINKNERLVGAQCDSCKFRSDILISREEWGKTNE